MSDDKTPPIWKMPSKEACETLQNMLQSIANGFGLKIKVTPSVTQMHSYTVEARPPISKAIVQLDEDALFTAGCYGEPSPKYNALFDLLYSEVETLQMVVFDENRKFLDENDKRGRVVRLSRDEQHMLHKMLRDAENEVHSRQVGYSKDSYEATDKTCADYRALVGKLLR